jgi:hypothetical protein
MLAQLDYTTYTHTRLGKRTRVDCLPYKSRINYGQGVKRHEWDRIHDGSDIT